MESSLSFCTRQDLCVDNLAFGKGPRSCILLAMQVFIRVEGGRQGQQASGFREISLLCCRDPIILCFTTSVIE